MTSAMKARNTASTTAGVRLISSSSTHWRVPESALQGLVDVQIPTAAQIADESVHPVGLERPHLSTRECEVLRVWLHSDSKREIAAQLHLSVGTVNTYLTRVRSKYAALGRPAKTKSALMARALQDQIVSIDDF